MITILYNFLPIYKLIDHSWIMEIIVSCSPCKCVCISCLWCAHTVWEITAFWHRSLAACLLLADVRIPQAFRAWSSPLYSSSTQPGETHQRRARWEVRPKHAETHSHIHGWLSPLHHNSLYWHCWQLPGWHSFSHSDGLNTSLLLFITSLCFTALFFLLCATLKLSAQPHVAQHCSLFVVCLEV